MKKQCVFLLAMVAFLWSCKSQVGYFTIKSNSTTVPSHETHEPIYAGLEIVPLAVSPINTEAPKLEVSTGENRPRTFKRWAAKRIIKRSLKEKKRIFPKKKKTFGDYFNSKVKIGLVFLVISVGLQLLSIQYLPLVFAIASILYLAWGLKKAFR